jgi:hypothetical protein
LGQQRKSLRIHSPSEGDIRYNRGHMPVSEAHLLHSTSIEERQGEVILGDLCCPRRLQVSLPHVYQYPVHNSEDSVRQARVPLLNHKGAFGCLDAAKQI